LHKLSDNAEVEAQRFAATIPADKRKRLGQFFTGLPLGKLLAHLAFASDTRSILDPMAGHGDLLAASYAVARERKIVLERLEGIEIDPIAASFSEQRMARVIPQGAETICRVLSGSAFDSGVQKKQLNGGYDLVIANPPYVRYQSQNGGQETAESIRSGLLTAIETRVPAKEKPIWLNLANGYSGLADLSVPSWIFAALLVRPAGRLAIIVPATWRTREYGDVIRYLMLRCFRLEYVVEDVQPGWFSDALVRTQLIVAQRLSAEDTLVPLTERPSWHSCRWARIPAGAADESSLVGRAFVGKSPEAAFAEWLRTKEEAPKSITVRPFDLKEEWLSLGARAARRSWFGALELKERSLPLFAPKTSASAPLPEMLQDLIGSIKEGPLRTLEQVDIQVGQGLRTGCNSFFYVEVNGPVADGSVSVTASPEFGKRIFSLPQDALRPVLRRQAELPALESASELRGRLVDLRNWLLPEDAKHLEDRADTYRALEEDLPKIMPKELADYVRLAATTGHGPNNRPASELSAVKTNVRPYRRGVSTPRFWYMIPDFMPRHIPDAFTPRVVNDRVWTECNLNVPILIDANFSTFWSINKKWTRFALKALLNSAWCQAQMEALGTPLGGGALKLEATHLRRLLIPSLAEDARIELDRLGKNLSKGRNDLTEVNRIVLGALYPQEKVQYFEEELEKRGMQMRLMRQRRAA
jgi:hypothetical protein